MLQPSLLFTLFLLVFIFLGIPFAGMKVNEETRTEKKKLYGAPPPAVPSDATLSLLYPDAVQTAFYIRTPAQLAQTLETARPSLVSGSPFMAAHTSLFLAHIYDEKIAAKEKAWPLYKTASENIPKWEFFPEGMTESALSGLTMTEASVSNGKASSVAYNYTNQNPRTRGVQDAFRGVEAWKALRQGWGLMVERGLQARDKAAYEEGRAFLEKFSAGDFVKPRDWLAAAKGAQPAGKSTIEIRALHPDETDPAIQYLLPFFHGIQVFKITVTNKDEEVVRFNAEDAVLEAGEGQMACISEDQAAEYIEFSQPLEQFIYCELSPYTFSAFPVTRFNDLMVDLNRKVDEAFDKAETEKIVAEANAYRGRTFNFSGIANAMVSSSIQSDISGYRQKADDALHSGSSAGYSYYNSCAREAQSRNDYYNSMDKLAQANIQSSIDAGYARAGAAMGRALQMEEQAQSLLWMRDTLSLMEMDQCKSRVNEKLYALFHANLLLPKRGGEQKNAEQSMTMGEFLDAFDESAGDTNAAADLGAAIRVTRGQTWNGLLLFDTRNRALADGRVTVTVKAGKQPVTVAFPVRRIATVVIRPPLLTYCRRYIGPGMSWTKGISLGHMLKWYALLPVLL